MRLSLSVYLASALLILSVSVISGCSTLTNAAKQSVHIQAIANNKLLDGAACTIKNNSGVWNVKSSTDIEIEKSIGALTVECQSSDKLFIGKEVISSKSNGNIWTNVFTLGAGAVVDAASASGFDYPHNIIVILKKSDSNGGL